MRLFTLVQAIAHLVERWVRHQKNVDNRVFGFFTFCLNLFLYTILRVQIGMKKNRDSFF